MRHSIDGKIAVLSFCAIAAAVSTIVLIMFWMATAYNNKAARDTETMIAGGVEAQANVLRTIASDYAWWQEAYEKVRVADEAWIYANMGSAAVVNETIDLLALVDATGRVSFAWAKGSTEKSDPRLLPRDSADHLLEDMTDAVARGEQSVSVFRRIGGDIYLLAASPVMPESRELPADEKPHAVVVGYKLDAERIASIGKAFLIDDLFLATTPVEGLRCFPLKDEHGDKILGHLMWSEAAPGFAILAKGAIPLLLSLGIFLAISVIVGRQASTALKTLARQEAEAREAARTDPLTGLANRLRLNEVLKDSVTVGACREGRLAAIYLDVDGFKHVNDTVGHEGGDDLVRQIGERLKTVLPRKAFLARAGGDEFNILYAADAGGPCVSEIAAAITDAMAPEFIVGGKQFNIGASQGYAVSQRGALTPAELLRRADLAMYEAKKRRSSEPLPYREAYDAELKRNLEIGNALRTAIAAREVEIHYQPILNAGDRQLQSVEALVRWTSPEHGKLSPSVFVPAAEDIGLIGELGTYVLEQVCRDLAAWPQMRASVNVSPIQLRHPGFVDSVIKTAHRASIDPTRIELELTERVLVSIPAIANDRIARLRQAGFAVSLDDFGTGYSSIGYLQKMTFDKLKIDRSFVSAIESDPNAASIVHNIAGLAKVFGLIVVAEGVETEEQARVARLAGCDLLQGFLFSQPVSFQELVARYRAGDGGDARLAG